MTDHFDVAVIGSGFAGSLMARVLAVLGYDVVLLERGTHPRFAIGESSTPLANLSLERLARRYGLADCYRLAAHGRWLEHFPDVRRGLKRGFTFYRHHPGATVEDNTLASERLLVAASPNDAVADSHWLRADVDHHFVREAIAAGVDYRDRVELTGLDLDDHGARLTGQRAGAAGRHPGELRDRCLRTGRIPRPPTLDSVGDERDADALGDRLQPFHGRPPHERRFPGPATRARTWTIGRRCII